MFRSLSGRRLTPFLLTRYLESDWRQPASREEDADQASERLTSLIRAQLASTAVGGGTSAGKSATTSASVSAAAAAAKAASAAKEPHGSDGLAMTEDGIASTGRSSSSTVNAVGTAAAAGSTSGNGDLAAGLEDELDALTAEERDAFDVFDASSVVLPMREARWLLNVFTKSGRIDDAALVITSIRKWNKKYFQDAETVATQNNTAGKAAQDSDDGGGGDALSPLSTYHLNCLLRLLLHHREKDAAVQLLDVMSKQRMVDAETISICVTGLHTFGARDRWSRILALVDAAAIQHMAAASSSASVVNTTTGTASGSGPGSAGASGVGARGAALLAHQTSPANFVPLAVANTREAADVAAVWPRPPRRVQAEIQTASDMLRLRHPRRWALEDVEPEPPLKCAIRAAERGDGTSEAVTEAALSTTSDDVPQRSLSHAPILSALLAAAATGPEGPVAAMLCAFWIKAVGAELSATDYFHLLMTAQRCRTEALDAVFQVFGRDATCPHGCISLDSIERRLKVMGPAHGSHHQQQPQSQAQASSTLHHQAPITSSAHAVAHAMELLPLVRASLRQHGVGGAEPVYLGFANVDRSTPMADVRDFTDAVFDEVHRRPTVGAFGEAPTNIHHAHLLLLSQTRVDCAAPLVGFRSRVRAWRARFGASEEAATGETPQAAAERAAWVAEQRAASQRLRGVRGYSTLYAAPLVPGADVSLYGSPALLKDVAVQFPRAGRHLHERVAAAYEDLCSDARADADEVDVAVCWALGLPLVHDPAERDSVIDFVLAAALSRSPLKSIRQMMRGLLAMLAADPPRRLRPAAPSAIAEREQWARYFEARDAALALFGQTKAGREAMRAIFMQHGQIPPMRGGDAIRADQEAAAAIFEYDAGDITRRPRLTKPLLTTPTGEALPLVPTVATRPPGMKDPFRRLEGVQFATRHNASSNPAVPGAGPAASSALASGQQQKALPASSISASTQAPTTANSIVASQFSGGGAAGGILAAAATGAGAAGDVATAADQQQQRMINPTAFDALAAGVDPLVVLRAHSSYGLSAASESAAAERSASAARQHAERLRLDANELAAIEDSKRRYDANPAAAGGEHPQSPAVTPQALARRRGGSGVGAPADAHEDPFDRVRAAMQKIQDKWWLTEPDTALNYVLLLLQRYEWTEAIEVMKIVKVKQGFTASHDHDLQKAFDAIGDPAGSQCFKFAAQLIDGRISDNEAPGAVRSGYSGHAPKKQSLFAEQ